jgi:hypothetical protein
MVQPYVYQKYVSAFSGGLPQFINHFFYIKNKIITITFYL